MWSGTPDQGSTNREAKDALLRNLASWAKANYATVKGPGLVALQDGSEDVGKRYDWAHGGSPGSTSPPTPAVNSYSAVRTLTSTATAILGSGGSQIAYANMASLGFLPARGAANVTLDAVGQTGTAHRRACGAAHVGGGTPRRDGQDGQGRLRAPGTTVTITGAGFQAGET
jgi:hypothetical protein